MTWQPIETAKPSSGPILGWARWFDRVRELYWNDCQAGWCDVQGNAKEPTDWMPLPLPPRLSVAQEGEGVFPGRCQGRYPVSNPRNEPFDVTYRCMLVIGHSGPCGTIGECWKPATQREPAVDLLQPDCWCDSKDHTIACREAQAAQRHWMEEPATPPPALPPSDVVSLHRCKICGTAWLLWPDVFHGGGWNLLDKYQHPGVCCDNAVMGEQIEHLRDIPLNPPAPNRVDSHAALLALVTKLHNDIMNLRVDAEGAARSSSFLVFKSGHKVARHDAAELVANLLAELEKRS